MDAPGWRLEVAARHTRFTAPDGRLTDLPLGHDGPGALAFGTAPPRPAALEEAIMDVEDALMARLPDLPRATSVQADGAALASLAPACGSPGSRLTREAVEEAFRTLAAVAEGRPAASAGLPASAALAAFAATLLIVREVMHHLDIGALILPAA